jgi:hypothetical protein
MRRREIIAVSAVRRMRGTAGVDAARVGYQPKDFNGLAGH